MDNDDLYDEEEQQAPWWRRVILPVAVLVVAVGIMCGLVLGGVFQTDNDRLAPGASSTTAPTVEISP